MPQVSRRKLSKKIEEELIHKLTLVLSDIGVNGEMNLFLGALLTDTEKLMLAKRLAIIVLLEEKLSDSRISEILHLTRITVAKMRFFYEARGEGYKIAIKKLEKNNQYTEFKKMLLSITRYTIRAAGGRVKPSILD